MFEDKPYIPAPPHIEALPLELSAWSEDDHIAFLSWFRSLPKGPEPAYRIGNSAVAERWRQEVLVDPDCQSAAKPKPPEADADV